MSGLGHEVAIYRGPTGVLNQGTDGSSGNATFNGGMSAVADTGAGGVSAFSCDNVNDYLGIPFGVLPNDYPFAVSFWAKRITGDFNLLTLSDSTSNDYFYYFGYDTSSKPTLYAKPPGFAVTCSSSVSANSWHHLVVNFSAINNRTIYIDAGESANATTSGPALADLDMFSVGALIRNSTGYYSGSYDDIHVYDQVLTSSERSELYSGQRGYDRSAASIPPTALFMQMTGA